MSRSQIGSVIYGLITVIPLQRIAHFYLFGALGYFSLPEFGFGIVLGINCLRDLVYKHSSPGEVNEYVRVLKTKDAREAAFNWYRANKELLIPYHDVSIPTLHIWGNEDIAFGPSGIKATQKYMKGEYKLLELKAGHTLIQEEFDKVSTAILGHLQKYPIP